MSDVKKKKGFDLPHVYIVLMVVMLLVVVLSYIIPSGQFGLVEDPASGRMVVNPQDFNYLVNDNPISFMDFFKAIHIGIVQSADIIVMLLIAVGAIYVLEKSGAIAAGIHKLLEVSEGKELLILSVLTLMFTILGAIGFGEGGLPFIPLTITVVLGLGYDRMLGITASLGGLAIGFTSGVLNLYTTGIGQSIVGLPLFSGIGFRIAALVVFYLVTMAYMLFYARKIKKDPSKSVVAYEYMNQSNTQDSTEVKEEFTGRRKLALLALVITFVMQAIGTTKLGWGLAELSALYVVLTVILTIVLKLNPSQTCVDFAYGASRLLPAALAIGVARSVMVLMTQAKIVDTTIFKLSEVLQGKGSFFILLLVYIAVIVFNFFVISGSGKAVILMPILGPLGQLVNINQQVMILLYNYGDGFTNYLWPTSGALMAALALGGVNYQQWVKYSWKLFVALIVVGFGLILVANGINLGPF